MQCVLQVIAHYYIRIDPKPFFFLAHLSLVVRLRFFMYVREHL
jgi:hypothetical protein